MTKNHLKCSKEKQLFLKYEINLKRQQNWEKFDKFFQKKKNIFKLKHAGDSVMINASKMQKNNTKNANASAGTLCAPHDYEFIYDIWKMAYVYTLTRV